MTTETAPRPSSDEMIAKLKAELKAEKAASKKKDERIAELKPTRDVTPFMFQTTDDVREFFGEEKLIVKVKERLAAQNRIRMRQGYERLPTDPESIAEMVEELVAELVDDRHSEGVLPSVEGWLDRTLKMIRPDGMLIQIPYEGQINNTAGSLADGIERYRRKGFKLTEPMLCPTKDCYEVAAAHEKGAQKGRWIYDGYCSEDHRNRTERGGATQKVPSLS